MCIFLPSLLVWRRFRCAFDWTGRGADRTIAHLDTPTGPPSASTRNCTRTAGSTVLSTPVIAGDLPVELLLQTAVCSKQGKSVIAWQLLSFLARLVFHVVTSYQKNDPVSGTLRAHPRHFMRLKRLNHVNLMALTDA